MAEKYHEPDCKFSGHVRGEAVFKNPFDRTCRACGITGCPECEPVFVTHIAYNLRQLLAELDD